MKPPGCVFHNHGRALLIGILSFSIAGLRLIPTFDKVKLILMLAVKKS